MKNYENKAVLAKNIQRYLNRMGMNKKDLSVALNLPYMTVSNWLLGKSYPRIDKIEMMANFFGCQKTDLIEDKEAAKPVKLTPNRVPLIGRIACGTPILAEENYAGRIFVPENVHADFALTCSGDSMIDAGIYNGDTVFVRQQPEVENGEIAAVLIDDCATLKRVYLSGGTLTLLPANSTMAPMVFSGKEMENARIIGKAVCIMRKLE